MSAVPVPASVKFFPLSLREIMTNFDSKIIASWWGTSQRYHHEEDRRAVG